MSVYFFYGDEDYLMEQEILALRKQVLDKDNASINYKVLDKFSFPELISVLKTQSLLFGNQLVVINCESLYKDSLDDSQIKQISDALEINTDALCVVFKYVFPRNEKKKPDSRKKIHKVLTKFAQTKEFKVSYPSYQNFSPFVAKEAKKLKISLDKEATETLIDRVGNNYREYINELEKLRLLAYPETKITVKMVKEICIKNEDIFKFIDLSLKKDKSLAILEYRKLLETRHPLEILSTTQTMLRKWITIKMMQSEGVSISQIAQAVNSGEWQVKDLSSKLKPLSLKMMVDLKQRLINAENRLKTGKAVFERDEVEYALF